MAEAEGETSGDFSEILAEFKQFGEIEIADVPRFHQIAGARLARNWTSIPHVTHHDEADITEFELRRTAWNTAHPDRKVTYVPVLGKLLAEALAAYPQFNASLLPDGARVVMKKFFHVGFAIDTPRGLMVAAVRDCDRKSISEIAGELVALSAKARSKGLSYKEISGPCMTITSLGHIGGTAFTPIINAPEVAILGVSATQTRAAPDRTGAPSWRKMLPLSLSYDHRLINGADAARFVRFLAERLAACELA